MTLSQYTLPAPARVQAAILYTIGYSRRSMKTLVNMLLNYGIERVIDVRYSLNSWNKHFQGSSERLELSFGKHGFDYQHWPKFGNPPRIRNLFGNDREAWQTEFFSRFTSLERQAFRSAFRMKLTALMCAEINPRDCHRTEIATWLTKGSKMEVRHL